jgi:hypothetical protein
MIPAAVMRGAKIALPAAGRSVSARLRSLIPVDGGAFVALRLSIQITVPDQPITQNPPHGFRTRRIAVFIGNELVQGA